MLHKDPILDPRMFRCDPATGRPKSENRPCTIYEISIARSFPGSYLSVGGRLLTRLNSPRDPARYGRCAGCSGRPKLLSSRVVRYLRAYRKLPGRGFVFLLRCHHGYSLDFCRIRSGASKSAPIGLTKRLVRTTRGDYIVVRVRRSCHRRRSDSHR